MQGLKSHLSALGKALVNSGGILILQISLFWRWCLLKRAQYMLGKSVEDHEFTDGTAMNYVEAVQDCKRKLSQQNAAKHIGWKRIPSAIKGSFTRLLCTVQISWLRVKLGHLVGTTQGMTVGSEWRMELADLKARMSSDRETATALRNSTPLLLRYPALVLFLVLIALGTLMPRSLRDANPRVLANMTAASRGGLDRQDLPRAATFNSSESNFRGASIEDTLDFIRQKLLDYGAYQQVKIECDELTGQTTFDLEPKWFPFSFNFADLDLERIYIEREAYMIYLVIHCRNDEAKVKQGPSNHRKVVIKFSDRSEAERVGRAMAYLIQQFGGESVQPKAVWETIDEACEELGTLLSKTCETATATVDPGGSFSIRVKAGEQSIERTGMLNELNPSRFEWEDKGERKSRLTIVAAKGKAIRIDVSYSDPQMQGSKGITRSTSLTFLNSQDAKRGAAIMVWLCKQHGWRGELF